MNSISLISRGVVAIALTVIAASIATFVSIGALLDEHLKAQAALELTNEPKIETLSKDQLGSLPVRPNELTAFLEASDIKNQVFIVPQNGFDELLKISKNDGGNFLVTRKQAGALTWFPDNARSIAIFVFTSFVLAGLFAAAQLFLYFRPLSVLRKSAEDILAGRFEVLSGYSAQDDLGRTFAALRKLCVELEDKQVALEKVSDLATKDGLTGLKNHRSFKEELKRLYALAKRHSRTFGLVILDVDHFKKFNDTYGHQQGDEVLKQVAVALQGAVRVEDFIARYGGEEFIVLLPDTGGDAVTVAAERLRAAIEDNRVKHLGKSGETLRVTASAGGVAINPSLFKTDLELTKIIEIADRNLYEAKRKGRNCVVVSQLTPAA